MIDIGVDSAILEYNDDTFGIRNVLKRLNVVSGVCFAQGSVKRNLKSVKTSNTNLSDEEKKHRKTIRKIKKKNVKSMHYMFLVFLKYSVSFSCYYHIYLYFSHI